jgi:hypothetical protein
MDLIVVKMWKFAIPCNFSYFFRAIQWCYILWTACHQMTRFEIYLFDNYFLSSSCRAPSLTREWVCDLQCNHAQEPRRTHKPILPYHLRLPQLVGPSPLTYIPQEQGGPVTTPGAGFPFRHLLDSQGYDGGILTSLHTGNLEVRSSKFEVTLRLTISQSVEHTCGTCDRILLPIDMLLSKIFGFLSVGCSLWREDGSAICNAITQWSELHGTCKNTLLSHLRLLQTRGLGSLIYIPQEQGGTVIPSGIGFPLRLLLRLAELRWRYSNPLPTWRLLRSEVTLRLTVGQSVSQSVRLGVKPILGLATRYNNVPHRIQPQN